MPALTTTTNASPTIQADLDELSSLLWETFRGLRQSSPPPTALLEAGTWGSLSSRHKHALSAVATAGPLSVTDLARRLGLGLSTTSALVGQLDRAGLVHRSEDATDRRRTIVRIHDDYAVVVGAWAARTLAPLRTTLESLPPEARAQFMQGWRMLHAQATSTNPPDTEECHASAA